MRRARRLFGRKCHGVRASAQPLSKGKNDPAHHQRLRFSPPEGAGLTEAQTKGGEDLEGDGGSTPGTQLSPRGMHSNWPFGKSMEKDSGLCGGKLGGMDHEG